VRINLAERVAEVRWGPDAREEFVFRPQAALGHIGRLSGLLAPPRH
jgi:hypothetical protein